MTLENFAIACNPPIYNVLGLDLKSLSLGHYLAMAEHGCNYASDVETEVGMFDLILGVLICSMTYEECKSFFNLPEVGFWSWQNLKSFGFDGWKGLLPRSKENFLCAHTCSKELGGAGYEIRSWGNRYHKQIQQLDDYNFVFEARHFQKYINKGSEMYKDYVSTNGDNRPSATHWSVELHAFLSTKYDETTTMNMPLVRAFMEQCKWAEQQGAIELMLPFEIALNNGVSPQEVFGL